MFFLKPVFSYKLIPLACFITRTRTVKYQILWAHIFTYNPLVMLPFFSSHPQPWRKGITERLQIRPWDFLLWCLQHHHPSLLKWRSCHFFEAFSAEGRTETYLGQLFLWQSDWWVYPSWTSPRAAQMIIVTTAQLLHCFLFLNKHTQILSALGQKPWLQLGQHFWLSVLCIHRLLIWCLLF